MKGIEALRNQVAIQGQHGNWDSNSYMLGMFNGLECALATMEDREPQYKSAPEKWLDDLSLPASSGPEQPKCKRCDDTKTIAVGTQDSWCGCGGDPTCFICKGKINYSSVVIGDCPDCAKDRAEPKCEVCDGTGQLSHHQNGRTLTVDCHGCHTPAPAAKEVMPRSE